MNTKKVLCTVAGSLLFGVASQAQNQPPFLYQISFNSTCAATNESGRIVSVHVGNKELLQQYSKISGVSNLSGVGLAYHVNGDELGDTIEVISRTNGATLYKLFGFYFGEDFDRPVLLSASGQQLRRIEYIFTAQNSHSVGAALLTDYFYFDDAGNTNKIAVVGDMHYLTMPGTTSSGVQVCAAHFTTLRAWTFPAK